MSETSISTTSSAKKGGFSKLLKISALLLLLAAVIYYLICGMTYSEGTRSGVLTKISKRGYVFKTYEGELNVGGLNQGDGTIMPLSIFKFSVNEDKIYTMLEEAQGKKVVLHYKEVIKSFFWQGESNYFVYQVTFMK